MEVDGDPALIEALLLSMGFTDEQVAKTRGAKTLEHAIEMATKEEEVQQPKQQQKQPQEEEETRMVIVVRTDLKMSPGKMASQVAHAAVALFARMQERFPHILLAWNRNNTPKICLRVDSLAELEAVEEKAHQSGMPCFSICDAGRTQIEKGSKTCVAICNTKSKLHTVTGQLRLL